MTTNYTNFTNDFFNNGFFLTTDFTDYTDYTEVSFNNGFYGLHGGLAVKHKSVKSVKSVVKKKSVKSVVKKKSVKSVVKKNPCLPTKKRGNVENHVQNS